jgi:flagellar basal body-associated protein FliL
MKTKIALFVVIAALASSGITFALMNSKPAGEHVEADHSAEVHAEAGVDIIITNAPDVILVAIS